MLYIVSTPIGNLKDFSFRAIQTLQNVQYILCEDTRISRKLLDHFDISKKLVSYHKFSENEKLASIIEDLIAGIDVALISDAGTPLISDPGNILVRSCRENGVSVSAIPGACAVINSLVLSSFSLESFTFCGFVPKQKKEKFFDRFKNFDTTLVFYVTKNSFPDDIEKMFTVFGDRNAFLVREMTKMFEEGIHFKLSEQLPPMKGEMVLVVEGAEISLNVCDLSEREHLMLYLNSGMSKMEAVKKVAKERGVAKNDIYMLLSFDKFEND